MVTKHVPFEISLRYRCVLAKIHMVTKLKDMQQLSTASCVLAKIHMVTKQSIITTGTLIGCVLAKIHMVTKLLQGGTIKYDQLCSSKNPYGNKTHL